MATWTQLLFASLLVLSACSTSQTRLDGDEDGLTTVVPASNQNDAEFLISMAYSQMTALEEGRLAAAHASKASVQSYGRLLKRDQTKIIHEMRMLASSQNIVLPVEINLAKSEALKDVKNLPDVDLDTKIISMIAEEQARDVQEFKRAATSIGYVSEPVRAFAAAKLSLLQAHLQKSEILSQSK